MVRFKCEILNINKFSTVKKAGLMLCFTMFLCAAVWGQSERRLNGNTTHLFTGVNYAAQSAFTRSPNVGQLRITLRSDGTYYVDRYIHRVGSYTMTALSPSSCILGCPRYKQMGRWINHMRDRTNTPLFTIQIGNTVYKSSHHTVPVPNGKAPQNMQSLDPSWVNTQNAFVSSGKKQVVTQEFRGEYPPNSGNTFIVTIKISYDTTQSYLVKEATFDMRNIGGNPNIKFAYGFLPSSGENNRSQNYAFVLPRLFLIAAHNDGPTLYNQNCGTPSLNQIRGRRIIGAANTNNGMPSGSNDNWSGIQSNVNNNDMLDGGRAYFFRLGGRNFDRGFAGGDNNLLSFAGLGGDDRDGMSYNVVGLNSGNGWPTQTNPNQFQFWFGRYNEVEHGIPILQTNKPDLGIGVGYDNIRAGQISQIKTGLSFGDDSFDGELDFSWNNNFDVDLDERDSLTVVGELTLGEKDTTVWVYQTALLKFRYTSFDENNAISGIRWRIDFPWWLENNGTCGIAHFPANQTIWTGGTNVCGNTSYYERNNGTVRYQHGTTASDLDRAFTNVRIYTKRAGIFTIEAEDLDNLNRVLPTGSPATLVVKTRVGFANNQLSICPGITSNVQLKYDSNHMAIDNATISLSYSGDVAVFSQLPPATIVLPLENNSVSFPIQALPNAPYNSRLKIIVTQVDLSYIDVNVTRDTILITIPPAPSVCITASPDPVCVGFPVTVSAASCNGGAALNGVSYQWVKQPQGGSPANVLGETGQTYIHNNSAQGDVVSCNVRLTACPAGPDIPSNALPINITPKQTPSIRIRRLQ